MHVHMKMMSKGSKEVLTVLIVTHVTQVKRVKSGVCGFYTTLSTEYWHSSYSYQKDQKCTLYTGPLTPPRGKAIYLKSLPSCGFSCSPPVSLRRQLFLTYLYLSTTRVIAGKMHSQSPILKTKGMLSNSVILRYLQTKLHPPYSNQTTCLVYEFRSKKCLQCLKNVGLYNCFGGSRFSFWQSWLTWASRFANSQALELNAGVPTTPYSPESNCLYLALIWSVKELYSLWASCTVNKQTGFGMTDLFKCNVERVKRSSKYKHIFTQWNLRANWPWK